MEEVEVVPASSRQPIISGDPRGDLELRSVEVVMGLFENQVKRIKKYEAVEDLALSRMTDLLQNKDADGNDLPENKQLTAGQVLESVRTIADIKNKAAGDVFNLAKPSNPGVNINLGTHESIVPLSERREDVAKDCKALGEVQRLMAKFITAKQEPENG